MNTTTERRQSPRESPLKKKLLSTTHLCHTGQTIGRMNVFNGVTAGHLTDGETVTLAVGRAVGQSHRVETGSPTAPVDLMGARGH
jgi:hypothetical protein